MVGRRLRCLIHGINLLTARFLMTLIKGARSSLPLKVCKEPVIHGTILLLSLLGGTLKSLDTGRRALSPGLTTALITGQTKALLNQGKQHREQAVV